MQTISKYFTVLFTAIVEARLQRIEYYTKTGK